MCDVQTKGLLVRASNWRFEFCEERHVAIALYLELMVFRVVSKLSLAVSK